MPRYKTVISMRCEHGHVNLFEMCTTADSAEVAGAYALAEAALLGCNYCTTTQPLTFVQVFSTRELSGQIESKVWGYTCHCGEKVEVTRFESGQVLTLPGSKTVLCSKGHSRAILNQDLPLLERWEKRNE